MSRIGKKAIDIPSAVSVKLDKEKVIVKGKYGTLERDILSYANLELVGQKLIITRIDDSKNLVNIMD